MVLERGLSLQKFSKMDTLEETQLNLHFLQEVTLLVLCLLALTQ